MTSGAPRPLQMMLDLFGLGAPPPSVPPTVAMPDIGPPLEVAPAAPPADTLAEHPLANRRIVLQGRSVAYQLIRAQRRSIGFLVDTDGLRVRAPRAALIGDIEQALHEKADWIVRKLREFGQRQHRVTASRLVWQDGVQMPYLGQILTVRIGPGPLAAPVLIVRRGRDRIGLRLQMPADEADDQIGAQVGAVDAPRPGAVLWVGLAPGATPESLRELVAAWLQHQARTLFEQRLAVYAPALGVRWTQLALTNARTRWGSATSAGHIRLNWRLMHFRLAVIDYVVAHELAHLRVMDHSPRFWQTVASVMPDYAALRQELRQRPVPEWT